MKILLIHRYFWPDTPPYAIILRKIAKRLAAEGHDVTVLSTQPAYKPEFANEKLPSVEVVDGYGVIRLGLINTKILPASFRSVLNMVFFCARTVVHGLCNRQYNLVMISTSPPVLAGMCARLIARISSGKLFYHCMDIHPEIGQLSGEFSNPLVFRLLQSLDEATCKAAERVIVLSNDMRDAVMGRSETSKVNVEVIQNFELNDKSSDLPTCPAEYKKEPGCFRLIFAGNIGRFQGLESIVEAFMNVGDENVELVFLGDGKLKVELQEMVFAKKFDRIRFFPHQPIEIANEIIRTADIGIVSLSEGVYQYAYPTKVISYLSVACPLLVVIESESDMVKFVQENQIGICVDSNRPDSLAKAILELMSDRDRVAHYRVNVVDVYNDYYNEELVLNKWASLVKQVGA